MFFSILVFLVLSAKSVENVERVVNGEVINIEDRPFQVAVNYDDTCYLFRTCTYDQCGGAIISEKFIISAAHCFEMKRQYYIRAGSSYSEKLGHIYQIKNIFIHPNYTAQPYTNDLALIEVTETINFKNSIQPITMAWKNVENFYNQSVNASGYGATCFECSGSGNLQQSRLNTISLEDCKNAWSKEILTNQICAIDKRTN